MPKKSGKRRVTWVQGHSRSFKVIEFGTDRKNKRWLTVRLASWLVALLTSLSYAKHTLPYNMAACSRWLIIDREFSDVTAFCLYCQRLPDWRMTDVFDEELVIWVQKKETSIPYGPWLRLSWLFRPSILSCEVGQAGLVFGLQAGFVSRSVRAKLQVSVWSGHPGKHPDTHRQTAFWPACMRSWRSWAKKIILSSNSFGRSASLTRAVTVTVD